MIYASMHHSSFEFWHKTIRQNGMVMEKNGEPAGTRRIMRYGAMSADMANPSGLKGVQQIAYLSAQKFLAFGGLEELFASSGI